MGKFKRSRAEQARINGAMSNGPKTVEGRLRISEANTKHGLYAVNATVMEIESNEAFDFYRAAANSGQSAFYEPSDWQMLRVCTEVLIAATERGTATLYAEFTKLAASLMLTENERRRNYVELQRDDPAEAKVKASDGVRAALSVIAD